MMKKRLEDLQKLKCYTEGIDKDLTMILQTFQWDRKTLLQNPPLVTCKYNSNHKVPPDKTEEHEKECFLRKNGYSKDDQLLPEPLDLESSTLVKLRKEDIQQIITNASRTDPSFKKGVGSGDAEPMSLERLQASYSADERRAIHDAVVSAAPSCHDLSDLALLSAGGDDKNSKVILSRQEILLELRNMRRRRTKYRVAAKSRNYSDVLRDVIRTQMEHYNDGKNEETEPTDTVGRNNSQRDTRNDRPPRPEPKDGRYRYDGKIVPQPIQIKIEKDDSTERNYRDNNHKDKSDRAYRHETGSKDRRDRDVDRHRRDDRSRERRNEEVERSQRYGEHSRKRRLDDDHKERRHYYEESRDRRRDDEPDREYRTDKQSKDSSHKDHLEYQVKIEPGLEEDRRDFRGETSREKRHKDKRDKTHKHKDKKEKRRDRERSKERRREDRYEERSSERIQIKQEREDGARRDNTNDYDKEKGDRKHKSKSRRHDRSRRDGSFDDYYDGASEEIYDPHKKIKKEK